VDSSGIRLWYTSNRRPETASILRIAIPVDPSHFVPAGISRTLNSAYCASECTEATIPAEGVNIISTALHSHGIGASLGIRHVRDGVELPPVEYNPSYDFNFQQTVPHFNPIQLLPGDEFIMECWYDSTSRTVTTYGGESTREEMCMVFMYVYPKIDLNVCGSGYSFQQMSAWKQGAIDRGYVSGASNLDDYNVSIPGALDYYEDLWSGPNYSTRLHYCVTHDWNGIYFAPKEIVQITQEYVEPNPCEEEEEDTNGNNEWLDMKVGEWIGLIAAAAIAIIGIVVMLVVCVKCWWKKRNVKEGPGYSVEADQVGDTKRLSPV